MNILFATSEAVPFIKSGGLADVSGSLSMALRNRRHRCRVVLPLYEDIPREYREQMHFVTSFNVSLSWRNQYCGLFEMTLGGMKFYFLDNEYYFKRRGLYGFFDDAERFAFFSKAVLDMLQYIDFRPEIIHCNDWQTALIPVYLNVFSRHMDIYRSVKVVFTIHNIQYQGAYDRNIANDVLGLPGPAASIVEYKKDVNFMKGAIQEAEAVTTVSPSYAEEILDPYFAHGLDDLLRRKSYKLTGILNGLDYGVYDPQTDQKIYKNYSIKDLSGKAENKKELQTSQGLNVDEKPMVIGMVGRMVSHKGMDLVRYAMHKIMAADVQFVILGSGDYQYEKFFKEMTAYYPGRFAAYIGFDDVLAHKIYSGADVFLMPSMSEPCGLAQMISLRYGTLPIVHATGGLKDTITDLGGGDGNGYTFQTYNGDDMLGAIWRAFGDFSDKERWKAHMETAMQCDFSWGKSATAYIQLYRELIG